MDNATAGGPMPFDPSMLLTKVCERIAERCGFAGAGVAGEAGEAMVVELVANHVIGMLGIGAPQDSAPADACEDGLSHAELVRRNRDWALSLGACEQCFGESPHCARCHGRGEGPLDDERLHSTALPKLQAAARRRQMLSRRKQ